MITKDTLFCDYYKEWISMYKEGSVRNVTIQKYYMAHSWLVKLVPDLKICDITRNCYQSLINEYAKLHEYQTTMDFHHHVKCAILDIIDDGYITKDPTRRVVIKGKQPRKKKTKFLNQFELNKLIESLNLGNEINWDWFILLTAKTGLRFSEALGLTPDDFDFTHQTLNVNKTWDYKSYVGSFAPTKNKSSVRKIQLDWKTSMQFAQLIKDFPPERPIFVKDKKIYNSTVNDILQRHCIKSNIPIISIHGLRHTHASLLLFTGVSIASVAKRLGHNDMNTTQKTYLHIIQELESKDTGMIMAALAGLS